MLENLGLVFFHEERRYSGAKRVPVFSLSVVAVYLNLPNIFKSDSSKVSQWQIVSVQILGMFTAKSICVKQKECLSSSAQRGRGGSP